MKRFKNILFVSNDSKNNLSSLQRAVTLAHLNQAALTVVDVIEEISVEPDIEKRLGKPLSTILTENKLQTLNEVVEPFRPAQLISTRVLTGPAFAAVIECVITDGFDLVVKASMPPEGLGEKLLGSTDMHLLRKCPCPVWIDKPNKPTPYQRILAAIDPMSDHSSAEKIMQLATSLAQREEAKLEIVHAWELEGESILRGGRVQFTSREVDQLVSNEELIHIQAVNKVIKDFGLSAMDENVHLVKGKAVKQILEIGKEADLIVMGTIGRVGLPGFFIGNTAEEVMQFSSASILAVKPEGYVSPLA